VGDFVTVSDPNVYWGLPVNYRCIAAHTADLGNKPATGTWTEVNGLLSSVTVAANVATVVTTAPHGLAAGESVGIYSSCCNGLLSKNYKVASVPDAKLYIVGSHMPADIRDLEGHLGVHAVGFVDDLEGFLARRRLTIAPLRYGAGAKGKVAGSLAQGVPVVCTPIGAEGMQLSPGDNVLVGQTPKELAGHVVSLLTDDHAWHRMSGAGVAYARDVTSRATARQRLRSILDRL
jgi:hypothetical protein